MVPLKLVNGQPLHLDCSRSGAVTYFDLWTRVGGVRVVQCLSYLPRASVQRAEVPAGKVDAA